MARGVGCGVSGAAYCRACSVQLGVNGREYPGLDGRQPLGEVEITECRGPRLWSCALGLSGWLCVDVDGDLGGGWCFVVGFMDLRCGCLAWLVKFGRFWMPLSTT